MERGSPGERSEMDINAMGSLASQTMEIITHGTEPAIGNVRFNCQPRKVQDHLGALRNKRYSTDI
jgi:hypothetical protein